MLTAAATGAIGRGGWALITVIIPPLRSSLYLALIIALNGRENKPLSGKRPGQTAAEATTRSPMSGALVTRALVKCWAVLRAPAGKRLAPMLGMLVPLLRRDNELGLSDAEAALLVRISAATIDRRLAPERAKLLSRGRSHTKPGTLLKSQIPIRTWADWDDAVPGFVEIDLVGHEGGNASGEHCFTLTVTDIATGWTVNRSVRNKAQKWVFEALMHVRRVFPFPIVGIDSDYADLWVMPTSTPVALRGRGSTLARSA